MRFTLERQNLRRSLQAIVGERSPFSSSDHLTSVEHYIAGEFESYGLVIERDEFFHRGQKFHNLVAHNGESPRGSVIVVGAHFDSVPGTPGADDNASGVAVLLETARILAKTETVNRSLFCAFNLEESGMIGSRSFAAKLKRTQVDIAAMISLEMVGYTDSRAGSQKYPAGLSWFYPNRGDFIGVIGNWSSDALLRKFVRSLRQVQGLPVEMLSVPGSGGLVPAVRLSDHSPFWDLGYPALMITDTSFYRNPHYHSPSDRLETLNIDFMAKVCEGVIHAISGL